MTDYDRIAKSLPIDRTARSVIQPGSHYLPASECNWQYDPPVLVDPDRKNPEFRDLTGRRTGYFTVVGYAGKGLWWGMCKCGRYQTLRSATIKCYKPVGDRMLCCNVCDNTLQVKSGAESRFKAVL